MRPKNAIGKTLSSSPSFRSNPIRTITGPMIRRQKSSRQVGVYRLKRNRLRTSNE